MQASILLVCVVSLSLSATVVHGGLLVAVHPIGLEVNATNDQVTLQCTATSAGEISHWLVNGVQLDPASSAGVEVSTTPGAGGSSTLTISSYQPSHAGEYRCVARSLDGGVFEEVSHAAPVSHFTQRTFSTEPQDFTVYALPPPSGDEASGSAREAAAFNCEFSSLPRFGRRPVIVWEYYRASTDTSEVLNLNGSEVLSLFQYDHIGYFQLHTPTIFDDGSRVRCLARHPQDPSQQVESQWATITISNSSRPDDFPVFTTQMPSQMYPIEGQQLVMGCSKSTLTTSSDLQWSGTGTFGGGFPFFTAGVQLITFRNDIVPYGHSNIRVLDDSVSGVINETFTCLVTFGSDQFSWQTTIVQPPPPLPPLNYNDQSASTTLNHGSPGINLDVRNYTGPVTWWYNGALIPTDGSSQKYSISSDMVRLTILDIVLSDAGLYQAELTDAEPTQFSNFQIDVRGGAAFVLPPPTPEVAVDVDTPSILFDCLTNGNIPPVTSHSWTFNGEPISDSSKYILNPNGSLAVNDVQLSDAGVYTCTPENDLGSFNSSNVTLTVNGPAFVLPPLTPEVAVDVNTASILFDCLTDGNIPPVTSHSWTFNGELISPDSSKYILCPNGSLAVNDVQLSDAGVYTCTPENDLGSFNSSSVTLTVNGAAFVLPPPTPELTIDINTPSILFDCLTSGNIPPVTSHSWTFNGQPISTDSSKYTIYPNGSLAINDVQVGDAGMYTCTPQNSLGSANSSSVMLTVNGPPGIPSISHVSIVDGTSIFVNWTSLDDAINYVLRIRTTHEEDGDDQDDSDDNDETNDPNEQENIKTVSDLDTNKHVIVKADLELVYYFAVSATNGYGSSNYSAEFKFDPENEDDGERDERRAGLRGWEIALIVIFIILFLLLCCVFWVCVFICWRRENRTYYAAKKEKEMQDGGVEAYRQTGEPDSKDD